MRAASKPRSRIPSTAVIALTLAGALSGCLHDGVFRGWVPDPEPVVADQGPGQRYNPGATAAAAGLINQAAVPVDSFIGRPRVPGDAHRVVFGMALRLKGLSGAEVERSAAVAGTERLAPPSDLDLSLFGSRRIRFSRYEPLPGQMQGRSIAGLLDLEDGAGRRVTASFEADYHAEEGRLVLERTLLDFSPSETPTLEFFVVTAEHLKAEAAKGEDSYRRLRESLTRHAIDLEDPATWPTGHRQYLIVVLSRHRVAPDARLVLDVSRRAAGRLAKAGRPRFYSYGGWPVAVLPGEFDLRETPLRVRVKLATDSALASAESRKSRLIGLFAMTPGH